MLNKNFCSKPGAAGGGYKSDAQEFRLHTGHRACFACSERSGVDLLILRINVGHRSLQNDAHRGGRSSEDRLPADSRAAIGYARKAGQRKLRSRGAATRKCFIVKAKANIARRKRKWRSRILIDGHGVSLLRAVCCVGARDTRARLESRSGSLTAKKQKSPMIVGAWFSTRESVYQLLILCQGKYSTIFILPRTHFFSGA